jgi:hypothetical protein
MPTQFASARRDAATGIAPSRKLGNFCVFMEGAMERGALAPLSPNEEITLRRIAIIARASELRSRDVTRLIRLLLVEQRDGRFVLTDQGRARYHSLPKAPDMNATDLREFAAILKRQRRDGKLA